MSKMPSVVLKSVIASVLLFGTTAVAVAQSYIGELAFANFGDGVNAPISDASGNVIIGSNPYVADLFWSINTNASMDSLAPAGYNTSFFVTNRYGGGYFYSVNAKLPIAYLLAQVRAWDTNYGSTYYEARDTAGEFGFSNPIIVHPVLPPAVPSRLTGLQSFQLQRLPHT